MLDKTIRVLDGVNAAFGPILVACVAYGYTSEPGGFTPISAALMTILAFGIVDSKIKVERRRWS